MKLKLEQSKANMSSVGTFTPLLEHISTYKTSGSNENLIVVLEEPGHCTSSAVHAMYTAVTACILLIKLGILYCITYFELENRFD